MAIAPQLQRFVDEELARAAGLIERCLAGTLTLLRDHGGLTPREREHHFEIVEALQGGATRYRQAFGDALREAVLRAPQEPAAAAGGGLVLMDESRVEVDIEISRALQIIDSTAEWELRELQTFTSTLAGQQHVSAESNPLRPLAFATALWEAACAVAPTFAQRATLLRVSAGVMAGLLKTAWAAASSRLEAQGVQPGIYRTVILAAPLALPERGAAAAPATPSPRTGALGRLLDGLTNQAPGGRPGGGEKAVVDLLSRLFALMQADTAVPVACRPLIGRLQFAALRVAVQDPAMLDTPEHPVWQLMNRLAAAGSTYPTEGDRRLATLLAFAEALTEEIARAPAADVTTFRRALTRLDAFLAEQLQWQLREAQPSVESLQRAERRELLEHVLSQRLTEQMASVRTSAPIRRFVTGTWSKVLAEAMQRFGEQAEPTATYVKTVDDLLWSLQTPDHPQSRQRLIALLPGLLQRLREGMALVAVPEADQQAVLNDLMAVHTVALRPGAKPADETLTPQEIVQRMREEVISDPPPQRPFADSVIDLASMDTVPADFLASRPMEATDAEGPRRLETLAPGERQRIFLQRRWSVVQLLWRSEQGLYFLFAGERSGQTHSITRRALERLDAANLLQPLEAKPLVPRNIEALLTQFSLEP
ncbi:MAG: DUF1631 family protein [Piscinibacter sp.]|nr:DUF1631 family protein [Piscinibacter sp.]